VSDELMWRYFELLSFRTLADIKSSRDAIAAGKNPRDVKFELARELVARFHGDSAAKKAQEHFIARFQKNETPENLELITLHGEMGVVHLLKAAGLVSSTSDGIRMIGAGAVKIDGERVENPKQIIRVGKEHTYQVGKRKFARIVVK